MFNPNSIVGNMIQGGMYNGMPVAQPIGNILSLSNGYNQNPQQQMGGYYNPYNQGYYNPYLENKRRQQEEAQRREEERTQSSIWKKLSSTAGTINDNIEDIEQHIKKYDIVENNSEEANEMMIYQRLSNIHNQQMNNQNLNMVPNAIMAINNEINRVKQNMPDEMTMCEYFEKAGELLLDIRMQEQQRKNRNLGSLYNRQQYNELINLHSGNTSYFNSAFNPANNPKNLDIDDMEIHVPTSADDEYEKRRQAFVNSIMGG